MAGSKNRKRLLWYVDYVEGARPRPGRPPAQSHAHVHVSATMSHTTTRRDRRETERLCGYFNALI